MLQVSTSILPMRSTREGMPSAARRPSSEWSARRVCSSATCSARGISQKISTLLFSHIFFVCYLKGQVCYLSVGIAVPSHKPLR